MKLNYDDLKRLGFSDRKLIKILKEKANLGNVELGSLKKISMFHTFQMQKS